MTHDRHAHVAESLIRFRRKGVIPVEVERRKSRMTPTTRTVRDQGFNTLECDIPDGMTLAQYRARRARRAARLLRRRRRRSGGARR
jgi:hypothetical protein